MLYMPKYFVQRCKMLTVHVLCCISGKITINRHTCHKTGRYGIL